MLDFMTFSSGIFGKLTFKYENLTMRPYFSEKSEESMMLYKPSSTEFTIRVEGGLEALRKFIGPYYIIRVVLYDQQGLYVTKNFGLNVTLSYKEEVAELPDYIVKEREVAALMETRIETEIIGKITYISVFGEVDIDLEQNRLPVSDIPLKNINSTHLSVYIEPSEKW
jgi:hypothetical protein